LPTGLLRGTLRVQLARVHGAKINRVLVEAAWSDWA